MTLPKTTARKQRQKSRGGPRTYGRLQRALDETARREILAALKEASGNVTETAASLGISRRGLWKRMSALGIDPQTHRE
jgi:DNA-binding NtrC family response regulator